MKKLVLIMFSFLLFNVEVLAGDDIYYSPYSQFSLWSENYTEESDTIFVEKERRYKWYKESSILGDYYVEGSNDENYPLINRDDYIETPYSDWQIYRPENKPNRIINSRNVYKYRDMKEVRYIHLNNLHGSYGSLRISEIEVYAGNNKLDFDFICEGCSSNFEIFIKNGITYENMSYIDNDGFLRIDLNNYYPLDSLTIKLYLYDTGNETKRYDIKITRDPSFNNNIYSRVTIASFFTYSNLSQIVPFTYNIQNMSIQNPEWYDEVRSLEPIFPTSTRVVDIINEYQYKDVLYRYYGISKEYYNEYSKDTVGDFNLKDENEYKDYYRYKTRDKVVIKDKLIITDNQTTLNDFIINSTTSDIKIESDLDINKNGVYNVKYILPFKTISKSATVNILNNTLNELNTKVNKLLGQNQELEKSIELKNNEINELKDEVSISNQDNNNLMMYDEYINKIESLLNKYDDNLKLSIDMIKENKKMIEVSSNDNKSSKQNHKKISNKDIIKQSISISSIVLILISVIIMFKIRNKKRSNQN